MAMPVINLPNARFSGIAELHAQVVKAGLRF